MCKITLYCGDCLQEMQKIPAGSVDLVLTDPPYGTTQSEWDKTIPFAPMWEQLKRITKEHGAICIFGAEPYSSALRMSNLNMYKYDWVWNRHSKSGFLNAKKRPLKQHENISVFSIGTPLYFPQMETRGKPRDKGSYNKRCGDGDGIYGKFQNLKKKNNLYYPSDILSFSNAAHSSVFIPAQKPVPLLEYLIRTYTHPGETVLDFTMGSGSTGVACVNTGRNFIGIELDSHYFEVAQNRIAEAQESTQ